MRMSGLGGEDQGEDLPRNLESAGARRANQAEEGRRMSKRPREESHEDDAEMRRGCSPRTPKPLLRGLVPCSHSANSPARQGYLYLVLEDWQRGYSIYRLGEGDFESDAGLAASSAKCPLFRVHAQHGYACSFAAHGSKILAMRPAGFSPGIPVFDTNTLEMMVYPFPKSGEVMGRNQLVHATVGDGRLVSFISDYLEVLGPEPHIERSSWSWSSVDEPLPPFNSREVSSYALHPDGRTMFISAKDWSIRTSCLGKVGRRLKKALLAKRNSTFAFDTESLEWTHLGDWLLPFKGRAHYDRELDAWVGICRFEEGAGHLCCCDVPPAASGCSTMPAWKLGKDLLFNAASVRHWGATLVYMGDSRFCLVESRVAEDYDSDRCHRALTMKCFGLKFDKVGELVTSQYRAYSSMSYQTTHVPGHVDPVVFWM